MSELAFLTPQRKARLDAGISIRELETRTGINRGMLSLYERGRYLPTVEEQLRIATVLDEATRQRIA